MKRSFSIVGLAFTLALLLFSGLDPTSRTTSLAAATIEAPALLRAYPVQSEGQEILERACTICHDLGGVDEFQEAYDEGSLRELVATMVSYGAQITDEETDTLVAYLAGSEVQAGAPAFDEVAAGELLTERCTTCHDLTGIERGLYPAEEWRETVYRMMDYGLTLSTEEVETILMYLGTSPGGQIAEDATPAIDETAGADLVNSRCTTCHDLTGIERGLYSADDWRETVGRMLGYGLSLSDDEYELVVNYLGSAPADEAADEDSAIDTAAAASLVTASCTTCHDLTGIEPGLYPADDWRETISRMLGYGLNISDDDVETIVNYLGSSPDAAGDSGAGPAIDEAAAADLINSSCTTCHDLTAVERGIYSADDWRETVSRMMGYGLNISDDEFDLIVTYLGSSPDAAADAYDAAAAEALLNGTCTSCHDLSAITSEPGAYTEVQFRETIERMLGYGVTLNDDEINTLVRFLTETYGVQ